MRASDPDGVLRVMVACTADDGQWQTLDLTEDDGMPVTWRGAVDNAGEDASCLVQAVDNADNIALTSAKGQLYLPDMPYRAYLPAVSAR